MHLPLENDSSRKREEEEEEESESEEIWIKYSSENWAGEISLSGFFGTFVGACFVTQRRKRRTYLPVKSAFKSEMGTL